VATTTRSRTSSPRSAGGNRLPLLLGGAVVVLVAVVLGVLTATDRQEAVAVGDVAGSPVIDGQDLPALEGDPGSDPTLGTRAPVVTGEDFDGQQVVIGESGTPQLVMFLASWCPACQAELPEVVTWLEEGNLPADVELTAVATGLDSSRPNWPPEPWFEEEGYDGRVLVDDADGSVARAYGLSATPFWVALDAEGQVAARVAGMLDTAQLTQLADVLAAG
jgi:cytochrome c biogenesis protein CcmG, thiol:disulfide interchange protein DsbE